LAAAFFFRCQACAEGGLSWPELFHLHGFFVFIQAQLFVLVGSVSSLVIEEKLLIAAVGFCFAKLHKRYLKRRRFICLFPVGYSLHSFICFSSS